MKIFEEKANVDMYIIPIPFKVGDRDVLSRGATEKGKRQVVEMESLYWQTPQAKDYKSGETIQDYGNARPLNEQVVNWATPRAEDSESCGNHPGASDSLTGQSSMWGTPCAGDDSRTAILRPSRGSRKTEYLSRQTIAFQSSPLDHPTQDGKTCWCKDPGCALPGHKRKLNPIFTTWLMGWPLWWLLSAPERLGRSGMESYRFRLRMRLRSLLGGRAYTSE